MENITKTIENALYGYDPNQYLPIYQDGELANRSAFIGYKIRRAAGTIGHLAAKAGEATIDALDTWVQSAN